MRFVFVTLAVFAFLALVQRSAATRINRCFLYPRPNCSCGEIYAPVIATNGCGYSNECEAYCYNAVVATNPV